MNKLYRIIVDTISYLPPKHRSNAYKMLDNKRLEELRILTEELIHQKWVSDHSNKQDEWSKVNNDNLYDLRYALDQYKPNGK